MKKLVMTVSLRLERADTEVDSKYLAEDMKDFYTDVHSLKIDSINLRSRCSFRFSYPPRLTSRNEGGREGGRERRERELVPHLLTRIATRQEN
jgi:hypothetical protein